MPKLMDVLEYLDNTGHTMVKRLPDEGPLEIKWGAQLTVRESQVAVFFRDGRSLDVFGPGRYVLQTQNIPAIGKWVTSFGYGPDSPFRSEVYFLNMKLFPNLKWGTKEPILFQDTELKMIRLGAHGIFSIQISEPTLFLNKVVGTQGLYEDNDIHDYLRSIIVSRLTNTLAKHMNTIFDMPKQFTALSLATRSAVSLDFEGLGISPHEVLINSFSIPEDVQKMIDSRTGMTAVGNLTDFVKFQAAKAIEAAAENPQGGAAAGVSVGAGLGMGFMIPQILKDAIQPSTPQQNATETIRKLKELLDAGAISKEEFEEKKKKLLDEI